MSTPDAIVPKSPEARPGKEVKPEHTGPHRPWGGVLQLVGIPPTAGDRCTTGQAFTEEQSCC